jgi:hypothetical protein
MAWMETTVDSVTRIQTNVIIGMVEPSLFGNVEIKARSCAWYLNPKGEKKAYFVYQIEILDEVPIRTKNWVWPWLGLWKSKRARGK